MLNERCLCVGGADKITLIDILLTGTNNGDITQWKINENNLTLICKKEKALQGTVREIIRFNDLIISCSDDKCIKVW